MKKKNIPVYRGSLNDVLARFYFASKKFRIKDIVRITSDCPLIDPMTIDKVCKIYSKINMIMFQTQLNQLFLMD